MRTSFVAVRMLYSFFIALHVLHICDVSLLVDGACETELDCSDSNRCKCQLDAHP